MTLIVERDIQGAQTHAIIIGVGHYPHLEGGPTPRRNTLDLKQLTSPPHSALAIAKWLKATYDNPEAPLATVELLVSKGAKKIRMPNERGERVTVEQASMANARAAILRWVDRANARRDNVTVFYFCGHGVAAGLFSGLLLEDFGADHGGMRLLENVIDLEGLHLGMDLCRARRQVYFIDACRNTPHEIAKLAFHGGLGDPIFHGYADLGVNGKRSAPIFYACQPGQQAEADKDAASVFTKALLETLNGAGADNLDDRWEIPTDSILRGLIACVKRQDDSAPEPAADKMARIVFHRLPGPPEVAVTVDCDPTVANEFATMSLEGRAAKHERPPQRPRWELFCPIGSYDVCAKFEEDRYRSVRREGEVVAAPGRVFKLDVGQ